MRSSISDNLIVPHPNFLGMPELELETVFELEPNESLSSSSSLCEKTKVKKGLVDETSKTLKIELPVTEYSSQFARPILILRER